MMKTKVILLPSRDRFLQCTSEHYSDSELYYAESQESDPVSSKSAGVIKYSKGEFPVEFDSGSETLKAVTLTITQRPKRNRFEKLRKKTLLELSFLS